MGKMFFNILATFAEFEADLLKMRGLSNNGTASGDNRLKTAWLPPLAMSNSS
jgi:hypothetical protein